MLTIRTIKLVCSHPAPTTRSTLLLHILDSLAQCSGYRQLFIQVQALAPNLQKREQITLSKLLDVIHANYQRSLVLEDLAALHGMSESTLIRFFRRMMGQSVNQYIISVRLAKACSLLIHSDLSIAIVAQQAGFANLANFNRLFKLNKSLTPRMFRNKFRN